MGDRKPTLDQILPRAAFVQLCDTVLQSRDCSRYGCPYTATSCRMNALCDALREWWQREHPGRYHAELEVLTGIISRFKTKGGPFYYLFWPNEGTKGEAVYLQLLQMAKEELAQVRPPVPVRAARW